MSAGIGAGQAGDGGVLGPPGDLGHGLEIAVRGDREARLDDVDAHGVEQFGDLELFLEGHRGAGALLAVAERGVEDQNAVLGGPVGGCIGHGLRPVSAAGIGTLEILQCGPARSWVATPESPGVLKPSRPSGAAKKQETGQKRARGRRPNGRVEHHAMGAG